MRLSLLDILKEEIKEQGYGTYMQDLKLPSGERLGDISGFDFEKNQVIKNAHEEGLSIALIAKLTGLTEDEIITILKRLF